ncbi:MAG: hypothetical protein ABSC53_00275 [Bacteroidota bacterium]
MVVVLWVIFAAFEFPELLLIIYVLCSGILLELAPSSGFPLFALGGGISFQLTDFVNLVIFVVGISLFVRQGRKPMFLIPLFFFFFGLIISVTINIGDIDSVRQLFNSSRLHIYMLSYFGLLGIISTEKRFWFVVKLYVVVMFLAFIIQLYGFINGEIRVGHTVEIGKHIIPYVTSKAAYETYLVLFVSLGIILLGKKARISKWYLPAIVAVFTFALALVRQYWLMIIVGIISLLFISKKITKTAAITAFTVILFFIVVNNAPILSKGGLSLPEIIAMRFSSIESSVGNKSSTYNVRLAEIELLNSKISEKLFFGYGLGKTASKLYDNDVGVSNTIMLFGVLGLLFPISFTLIFFKNAMRLLRSLQKDSKYRGIVAGLIGAMIGLLFAYPVSRDIFSAGPRIIIIMAVLLESIEFISQKDVSIPSMENRNHS